MTEEQRIAIIANAHRESKGLPTDPSVMELVADLQAEQLLVEHGLKDVDDTDVEDELSLITYNPSAEYIDEEDEEMGLSDEMKGVYHD